MMRKKDYFLLGFWGLLAGLAVAAFQRAPGYMDAEYYYAGGLRLAQGHGFSEMLAWNYLGLPPAGDASLPQPSHAYWMPLTSILAALGMWLAGSQQLWAARLGFLALAALLPALTAALSFALHQRRELAWLAGLLAVFSAFYLPYLVTTDAFSLYMFLGVLFWLLLGWQPFVLRWRAWLQALGMGVLAGALHLSRADGVMWLLIAAAFMLLQGLRSEIALGWPARVGRAAACGVGYLLAAGPWMLRNLNAFGVLLSPGGSRMLWLTDYDELFIYPASLLTSQRWLASGWSDILSDRLWAAGQNLQTAIAVQGAVFLLPLMILGLWRLRQKPVVRWAAFAWLLTFGVMTVIFPYAGARGGFFHSGAAFQPLFWAVAPLGLDAFISWAARLRRWNLSQARRIFQTALVLLAAALSLFVFSGRVIGADFADPGWNRAEQRYSSLARRLAALGAQPVDIVMVNNPAGYFVASQSPAIVIPYGDLSTLITVARRYQACYLLIELEQVQGAALYVSPQDQAGLVYLETFEGVRIYRFTGVLLP